MLGVVIVLRASDMKPIIDAFSLDTIECFLQASNLQNHAAFVLSPKSAIKTSHMLLATSKLQLLLRFIQQESSIIAIEFSNSISLSKHGQPTK